MEVMPEDKRCSTQRLSVVRNIFHPDEKARLGNRNKWEIFSNFEIENIFSQSRN